MIKMAKRLIGRLHRIFNHEVTGEKCLLLWSDTGHSVSASISELEMKVSIDGAAATIFDLMELTVAELVSGLDSLSGCVVSLVDPDRSDCLAAGLLEFSETLPDVSDAGLQVSYLASVLGAEIQAYGIGLKDLSSNRALAEKQLYMHSAEEDWLDFWGRGYFGIDRYQGESDDDYSARVINEIVRPNQNNYALELIVLEALGIEISLRDAYPLREQLGAEMQGRTPWRFVLDMTLSNELSPEEAQAKVAKVKDLVRKHKAAGTEFFDGGIKSGSSPVETVTATEALALVITVRVEESLLPGPIEYGTGWLYGVPGLVYGENEAIKEQIVIITREVATGDQVAIELHGG